MRRDASIAVLATKSAEADAAINRRQTLAFGAAATVALGAGLTLFGRDARSAPLSTEEALEERVVGDPAAPIELIEYASLTCPHCADFHLDTYPLIKEKYIDTGKVRLVMRDFPFDQPGAMAAMMARCASKDRYFQFMDVLFKTQAEWSRSPDWVGALIAIGKQGGLSESDFRACTSNQALLDGILEQRIYAVEQLQVNSTPTFFVNGEVIKGNQPFSVFEEAFEKILN